MSRFRAAQPTTPIAAALCLGAVLAAGCSTAYRAPQAAVHRELRTLPFDGPTPSCVEVHLRNGHVLVQHGEELSGDMSIEVWAEDPARANERARSVHLYPARAADGVYHLRASQASGAPLEDMQIRYRLLVPPQIKLRVFTHSAQVAVRGYRGDIEVHSETGEIEARPAGGTCKLASTSAPIRLAGTFASADIASQSGDVEVTLSPSSNVVLVAKSETGRVLVEMADDCRMWLRFTTENGGLDTDFPVVWRDSGPTVDQRARRFVGTVGDAEHPQLVDATVICGTAEFALRRLPSAPMPADTAQASPHSEIE